MKLLVNEVRFELTTEVSSNKYRELSKEEIEKIAKELKEILKADEVRLASLIERTDYLVADEEALCFFVYFKEIHDVAFAHVCISDPENIEAIFTDFTNSQEILNHIISLISHYFFHPRYTASK